jgi:hypothetical protein
MLISENVIETVDVRTIYEAPMSFFKEKARFTSFKLF